MKQRVCQIVRVKQSSGWLYLGFLANRALGFIAVVTAALDMRFESVDLPFEVYAIAVLIAVMLGWLEKETQQEHSEKIAGRTGIDMNGGTLKLRNTHIKGVQIAIRSKDAKIDSDEL